jgi:hypothetical protein
LASNQNVNEGHLPLSELLKQNEITNFDHLYDINNVHVNDLITSRIPLESDDTMIYALKVQLL